MMQRDAQILLVFLAVLAGCALYVVFDGRDAGRPAGQMARAGAVAEPAAVLPVGRCVEMRFLDENGVPVAVSPPLVGIMVGGRPLFEGSPPPFAKAEAGVSAPCPDALVASLRKTFADSCGSDERRREAAAANGVDIAVVNQRCGDMSAALPQ